ncbi:MAG: hypothetical protein JRF40_14760 [Deltaproteobacteria bacterium]|nr:hypothetical protein [Deltaproteobacteria bacterium]
MEKSTARENYLEQKRNEFLVSIYAGNFRGTEKIYKEIFDKINTTTDLLEFDQKAVNQIQLAFKTFREKIVENCNLDILKTHKHIRKRMASVVRWQTKNVKYIDYKTWHKNLGLTKEQFSVLLKTVSTLQMTVGCSISCRRCNEWALPGPRKHFTFGAVKRLIKELFEAGNNEFNLYCASDPLDWKCGDKTIVDILRFMSEHGYKSKYGLLTKVPKGSGKIIEALLNKGADIALSITAKNRSKVRRIENAFNKIEVQHDLDELLIPAGWDEDFSSIKPSITDNYGTEITPEGAFLIIPTFTSALNLTGQCRIPITADTNIFLKKKVGRDALPVEYFKPLEVIDIKGREFFQEELFDAQIENMLLDHGSKSLTPPGMMNLHEYFKTFESDAVERRKSLIPSVVKGLKEEMLSQKGYKKEPRLECYIHFKKHIIDYLEFSDMTRVVEYKKNAFSFYLKSIAGYLKNHSIEKKIILYLRKEDKKKYERNYHRLFKKDGHTIDSLLEELKMDTFDFFQTLMFKLMNDPDDELIQAFIENNPVRYSDVR